MTSRKEDRYDFGDTHGNPEIVPGSKIVLHRHENYIIGSRNWNPDMESHVGKVATVKEIRNPDASNSVCLKVKENEWAWRRRNCQLLEDYIKDYTLRTLRNAVVAKIPHEVWRFNKTFFGETSNVYKAVKTGLILGKVVEDEDNSDNVMLTLDREGSLKAIDAELARRQAIKDSDPIEKPKEEAVVEEKPVEKEELLLQKRTPRIGQKVILQRHKVDKLTGRTHNWISEMDDFVGTVATIAGSSMQNPDCVFVDTNGHYWEIDDIEIFEDARELQEALVGRYAKLQKHSTDESWNPLMEKDVGKHVRIDAVQSWPRMAIQSSESTRNDISEEPLARWRWDLKDQKIMPKNFVPEKEESPAMEEEQKPVTLDELRTILSDLERWGALHNPYLHEVSREVIDRAIKEDLITASDGRRCQITQRLRIRNSEAIRERIRDEIKKREYADPEAPLSLEELKSIQTDLHKWRIIHPILSPREHFRPAVMVEKFVRAGLGANGGSDRSLYNSEEVRARVDRLVKRMEAAKALTEETTEELTVENTKKLRHFLENLQEEEVTWQIGSLLEKANSRALIAGATLQISSTIRKVKIDTGRSIELVDRILERAREITDEEEVTEEELKAAKNTLEALEEKETFRHFVEENISKVQRAGLIVGDRNVLDPAAIETRIQVAESRRLIDERLRELKEKSESLRAEESAALRDELVTSSEVSRLIEDIKTWESRKVLEFEDDSHWHKLWMSGLLVTDGYLTFDGGVEKYRAEIDTTKSLKRALDARYQFLTKGSFLPRINVGLAETILHLINRTEGVTFQLGSEYDKLRRAGLLHGEMRLSGKDFRLTYDKEKTIAALEDAVREEEVRRAAEKKTAAADMEITKEGLEEFLSYLKSFDFQYINIVTTEKILKMMEDGTIKGSLTTGGISTVVLDREDCIVRIEAAIEQMEKDEERTEEIARSEISDADLITLGKDLHLAQTGIEEWVKDSVLEKAIEGGMLAYKEGPEEIAVGEIAVYVQPSLVEVNKEIDKRGLDVEWRREQEEETKEEVSQEDEEMKMDREQLLEDIIAWVQNYNDTTWPWVSVEDISQTFGISRGLAQKVLESAAKEGKLKLDDGGQIKVKETQDLYRFGLRTAVPRAEVTQEVDKGWFDEEEEEDPIAETIDKVIEEMEDAEVAPSVGRKIMSRSNMLDALKSTGRDALDSGRTGGKMAASKEFMDGIVTVAKETLPDEISMFLDTEVGERLAPAMLSLMTNFATHAAPQYVPHAAIVRDMSKSAMDACAYENMKDITAMMQPFFQRVGQMAASVTLSQQEQAEQDLEGD